MKRGIATLKKAKKLEMIVFGSIESVEFVGLVGSIEIDFSGEKFMKRGFAALKN
jgi:hypothetical protein